MASDQSSARSGRDSDDSGTVAAGRSGDDRRTEGSARASSAERAGAERAGAEGAGAEGARVERNRAGRAEPVGPDEGPESPRELPGAGWKAALRRTVREFQEDNLTDWAAALTYYGVLSIFPGLLVLVSILGLLGAEAIEGVKGTVREAVPEGNIQTIIENAITQAKQSGGFAGIAAILGLLAAYWSASGYIAAFMRASNTIYDVPEGRPIWKTLPIRLGVTAVIGVLLLASAVIVVFTGGLAEQVGQAIGLGSTAVTVWNIAKWPALLILVSLMFAILYWASPNAKHGGFRWVSPGGVLAVVIWLVVSGLFALYVANFGSYNKTYGAIAGVIIFLVWLWLTNIAILLGAEFDAELERSRAISAGHSPEEEPYVELRDDRKLRKKRNAATRR